MRNFHTVTSNKMFSLSISNTAAKVGFSFYFMSIVTPGNYYVLRVNLKAKAGRKCLFSMN